MTSSRVRGSKIDGPSVVLYSHDGYGLGHVSRTVHLAQQIREVEPAANILIITSSPAAHRVSALHNFEIVKLPSVVKTGTERYRPHRLRTELGDVINLRSALLLATIQQTRPDVFLVDHRPLGLKQEVAPTLRWLREHSPHTRTMIGLRDVVDDPQTVISDWKAQSVYGALEHLYDDVLVYGDRSILDTVREYALPPVVASKVQFTGYLGRERVRGTREGIRRALGIERGRFAVVHAGGGGDGRHLIQTYLECIPLLPSDLYSLVVTGPLMHRDERHFLQRAAQDVNVTLVEYQDDLASYIAAADLSISMGGYNTVCEVLSAGVPSIIIPRMFPRREQYIRARALASRGLINMLLPSFLTPQKLSDAVGVALQLAPIPFRMPALAGGQQAARIVRASLYSRHIRTSRAASR